ncbi:aminopeptidase [Gottfriedia acidiceleris]|uniref:Aminopeptidase n=1 Tax=Gottfriedia acidiceleris TaxID=371036 RepID=A0ABY4JPH8_9BACI|nr:aminopeptidase [Gottfriedia acidiceleris]UPM55341.1 aminopeptidase [Gottfriedia acidiceleris]
MSQFEKSLEKYAELAVKSGVNIVPGQTLQINAPIGAAEFVRKVVRFAYEAGAKNVNIDWNDDVITRTKYELAPEEVFGEFPGWKVTAMEELAENGGAVLSVISPNPELLKGIDPKRIATFNKTASKALHNYREYMMADRIRWSIVAIPCVEWAEKVYPNEPIDKAMELLWDSVFKICRVDNENPVEAWVKHNDFLQEKVVQLNDKRYKTLHYTAPGTDLKLDLVDNHVWKGGGANSEDGKWFNPNIPTEEVFSMPHSHGVNGTVQATLPLNYGGNLIENFSLTFKDGKVVDFTAEKGYDTLQHLLDTDEGARRLGEVALVPHDSPISNTGLIFFNTLYDENASCHLALGKAYPNNMKDGEKLPSEEQEKLGINQSLTHVDFMIGSAELNIDGIKEDGTVEPIMRNGNWAF